MTVDWDVADEAMRDRSLVRIVHGDEPFDGRVTALSDELVAIALLDPGIRYDGVVVLRTSCVQTLVKPHPQHEFYELVLAVRKQVERGYGSGFDMGTMSELLTWCQRHLELVTIHLTTAEPGVCHIGRIVSVSEESVTLCEVGVDAHWSDEDCSFFVDEIQRVDFGGAYEEALMIGAKLQSADG